MWLALVLAILVAGLLLAAGIWTGLRLSTSRSEAAEAILSSCKAVDASADRALTHAMTVGRVTITLSELQEQAKQQTESTVAALARVEAIDDKLSALIESLATRGVVKRAPRQAGEGPRTEPPPPPPASLVREARPTPR